MRAAWLIVAACAPAAAPPPLGDVDGIPIIPIGYDAYRYLDDLPRIRIGDRAYMRSTYDRSGGNEAADASHYLREAADGTYVAVDVLGPGYLAFARANHWHGSPWHYRVDHIDHVVRETATAMPNDPPADAVLLPADAFPAPLAVTWPTTRGADLSWVPIPFTRSLEIAHGRTHYGTGYYIFHQFPLGADHLSRELASWDERAPPDDVLAIFGGVAPGGDDVETTVDVPASGAARAFDLAGPATLRRLDIEGPAAALANARLVIHWDGRADASVDAPIGLVSGAGTFYDREARGEIVAGLMTRVSVEADRVRATLYFPMPFWSTAEIDLVGAGEAIAGVRVAVRIAANDVPPAWQGYFHATFVDHGTPVPGRDLVVLDTTAVEGGGDWCGTFNGTAFTFSDRAELSTLEGDPRMFFDDAESPQGHGTGTEEWAGGGDYWGGDLMTLPLAGHPSGAPSLAAARDVEDQIESAYRFLVADAMPFGKNARIQLEHGGSDDAVEHYRTVAYWYGRPAPCLVASDVLHVGDAAEEAAHRYVSSGTRFEATSRWDGLGPDAPASADVGRVTSDGSAFTVAIDPRNRGVLLRRKLDYAVADQRAEVFVAPDDAGPFVWVGSWYTAGSTSCVFSNPPGELDPGVHSIETSDRRWREDELLIPRAVTEGRSSIRIQLRVTSTPQPLVPGATAPAAAWTELRYRVYGYLL